MEFPLNEWEDKSFFENYVTPGEYAFKYYIYYENRDIDMPPSLYYTLLHICSSIHPNTFSFWNGIGVNLLLLLICVVVLFYLARELFGSCICALLVSACYGFSCGALNTMVLSEMYMLFTFALLVHILAYVKYWEQPEIKKRGHLLLGATLTIGSLTHYYFLIAAFFLLIWYIIKLLMQKRWRDLGEYFVTILVFMFISFRFSSMWVQMSYGIEKACAAFLNFGLKEYLKKLLKMFEFINEQMFGGLLWLIMAVILLLFILNMVKYGRKFIKKYLKVFPILFVAAGYFLFVTIIAPGITDEYMMPLFPIVMCLAVGLLYQMARDLVKREYWVILGCALLSIVLCLPTLAGKMPPYVFSDKQEHIDLMERYADKKAVYIDREFHWREYQDIIQLMKELDSYYAISYAQIVQWEIEDDLKRIYDDDETIVFVGNSALDEEITAYIKDTVRADEMILIDEYERWKIYRAVRYQ